MAPIRVGIIGLAATSSTAWVGAWGVNAHLRSILALPDKYRIVAVCNSSAESAQRSIAFHGLPAATRAYGSPDDLAADPDVDLVVVSVEVSKHLALARPAIERGRDVFVEWPLGTSVAQAEELARLAAAKGVRTMVGLQARHDPLVRKLKEILDSGKIGSIVSATVSASTSILPPDSWFKGSEWFLDLRSGGNEFVISFGHWLATFVYLLGDFASLQAVLHTHWTTAAITDRSTGQLVDPAHPRTAPDVILVQGTLAASGAAASIAFRKPRGGAADGVSLRWQITGTEGEIAITADGDDAGAGWQMSDPARRTVRVSTGRAPGEAAAEEVAFGEDHLEPFAGIPPVARNTARQYVDFAAADGAEVVTFEEALRVHRLLGRIAEAAGKKLN